MKSLRIVPAALLAIGAVSWSAGSASAASDWIQYREPDFTVAAGVACSFQVDAHVVQDKEAYRVLETYPDGTDKSEEWKGVLVIEFTNHDTGSTVTKNVNGRAIIEYLPDGSFHEISVLSGHFTTSIPAGNDLPQGVYYIGGRGTTMTVNPDGTRTVELGPTGTAENLCPELAG
jgi:hypothetical protein